MTERIGVIPPYIPPFPPPPVPFHVKAIAKLLKDVFDKNYKETTSNMTLEYNIMFLAEHVKGDLNDQSACTLRELAKEYEIKPDRQLLERAVEPLKLISETCTPVKILTHYECNMKKCYLRLIRIVVSDFTEVVVTEASFSSLSSWCTYTTPDHIVDPFRTALTSWCDDVLKYRTVEFVDMNVKR